MILMAERLKLGDWRSQLQSNQEKRSQKAKLMEVIQKHGEYVLIP